MKIAVIGSGITGLTAAWLLQNHYDVTLFEKNGYLGGHANTVDAPYLLNGKSTDIPVDTGFIVYNERTYPNLIGLFDHLNVPVQKTDMSFGVSLDNGRLEYGGTSLLTLFSQKRNLFSIRFHRMLRDLLRFYKEAPSVLENGSGENLSLGDFLTKYRYGDAFAEDHLLPMAAAIWSCSTETMRSFPAKSFIRFFVNHGLLELKDRPQWWTVKGGSREYVKRIRASFKGQVHLGQPVRSVRRKDGKVHITTDGDKAQLFDQVIFACHGDEAFTMLSDKTPREAEILGKFRYQLNNAVLHTDAKQMPKRRSVWSSWNYLASKQHTDQRSVAVTYWMNQLQSIDPRYPLFVTLNPIQSIDPEKVMGQYAYLHPIFDAGALDAQSQLHTIQGQRRSWFCGSYCGYGFHEDGIASATAIAAQLGVLAPWGYRPHHAMNAISLNPAFTAAQAAAA